MLLLLLVGAATIAPLPPARGHGAAAEVRYVIDEGPQVDGLEVQIGRSLAPTVQIHNRSRRVVEVLDDGGRPFLRIGPDGVEADVASVAWLASLSPEGLPSALELPETQPRWQRLRTEPAWSWFDRRLHEREIVLPPQPPEQAEVVDHFSVPLTVDGAPVELAGRVTHGGLAGEAVTRLITGEQPLPGVVFRLLPGVAPGVLVSAPEVDEVTVLGFDDEPFLRFSPEGVAANEASATWLQAGRSYLDGPPDGEVGPQAEPRWVPLADTPAYGWLDPRAVVPDADRPAQPAVLTSWAIPLQTADGEVVRVLGETRWMPAATARPVWPLVAAALTVGVAGVAVALLRRRRSAP